MTSIDLLIYIRTSFSSVVSRTEIVILLAGRKFRRCFLQRSHLPIEHESFNKH